MKIVIDVDKALLEGKITNGEAIRLRSLAMEETGSLAMNILVGFGVVATAGSTLALVPYPTTAIGLGFILSGVGFLISRNYAREWDFLGATLLLVGSLAAAGGILDITHGGAGGFFLVAVLFLGASLLAKSGLLAVLSVLALSATLGAMTMYHHATYVLLIRQPAVTVCLFSFLGLGVYHLSKVLPPDFQRLAIIIARTSVFLVNLGFWIGSLWGDSLAYQENEWSFRNVRVIPDWVFGIGWAMGLIATGVWAARNNKPWLVNLLAVFGSIHFYTQFFEHLGATPGSVLIAGLVALAISFAIARYNKVAKAVSN